MAELLLVSSPAPGISVISLNRPDKRNALSIALIDKITEAVLACAGDRSCRSIILSGQGPSFCAGLDLKGASVPGHSEQSARALERMYRAICQSPAITIAAAHGAAMGGGAGLLAACDLVVAADDLKLSYPEVKRGLIAALVTCLLRRQLSDRKVRELILLGQTISAQTALNMGLVTQVCPGASLMETGLRLAQEASLGAPGAIARTKQLLDDLAYRPLEEDLQIAMGYHLSARNANEAAEGIAAFLEKRPPKWGERPQ